MEEKWNAELYNDKHSFVYKYGESLIALLNPKKHERVLDLGCGAGQLTAMIQEKAQEVIGMDKSPEMIENAKANFPSIQFQTGDAANFSFTEKFDAVFSNATLHWVKDYKRSIQCMYRALKQDGRIVVEFGGKGNVGLIEQQIRKSLIDRGYAQQSELKLWYFPSIAEYATELERAGFEVNLAQLYDRPTELADEKTGIKDWIAMFADSFFQGVETADIENIKEEVQRSLQAKLFKNGKWYADYRRLRIVA